MGWLKKIYWYSLGMVAGACVVLINSLLIESIKSDNINTDYSLEISLPVKDVFNVYYEDQIVEGKLYRIVIAELNSNIISVKDCFTKAPILLPIEQQVCRENLIKT